MGNLIFDSGCKLDSYTYNFVNETQYTKLVPHPTHVHVVHSYSCRSTSFLMTNKKLNINGVVQ